ncbi:MAG TPA: HAMP domain-containing protein [Polyangiaceae bacterium]|nr:HAMP domain-containing protein [Polyangiaceae bacterium]
MGDASSAPPGLSAPPGTSTAPTGRHQRRLRNYLLDSHFQLKYTGYLVGIALLFSVSLGLLIWRTSVAVIAQSHQAVHQGEEVVKRGRDVVAESQKVSEVVKMNIIKDPVYSDNPALLDAFKADSEKQDERLTAQQKALEAQATALRDQATSLTDKQHTMLFTLVGALSLMVVLIGIAGILVTHKVAGPIYKMKRQLSDVGKGHLRTGGKLRKGDELVHFFDTFETMVQNLRSRQEVEIEKLERAISTLEPKAEPGELEPLYQLRKEMKAALDY